MEHRARASQGVGLSVKQRSKAAEFNHVGIIIWEPYDGRFGFGLFGDVPL